MHLEIKVCNEQELLKAAELLNKNGGKLLIDGEVKLTQKVAFSKPVSIEGTNNEAAITFVNNAIIHWRKTPFGRYAATAKSLSEYIESDVKVDLGDYILVQSDDVIDVDPHYRGGQQSPCEMHLVNGIKKGRVYVESFIVDEIQKNGSISIIEPISNFSVRNLQLKQAGKQSNYSNSLFFDGVANVTVENVHWNRIGPGALIFENAWDCRVLDCSIDGTMADDGVYGVVAGVVNGLIIDRCTITGCRHAFTTTAGGAVGKTRYGTPINVVVQNSIINVPTKVDLNRSAVGLDTHAEGWGIIFRNNLVNIGNGSVNVGIQSRSRNTIITGNTVRGGVPTKSCRLMSSGALVSGNYFMGGWYGVELVGDNNMVSDNYFENYSSAPIYIKGNNNTVGKMNCKNVLYQPSSGFKVGQLVRDNGKGNLEL